MSKRKKQKRTFTIKPSIGNKLYHSALDNLDHLWKLTERVSQEPLTIDEQETVQRVKLLLMLLLEDTGRLLNPPLTAQQNIEVAQQLEFLLQRSPFVR